jgi:hypothetical protein
MTQYKQAQQTQQTKIVKVEEPKEDPRKQQIDRLIEQIKSNRANNITLTKQIISNISLLMNDENYGKDNFASLSQVKMRYQKLLESLENSTPKIAHKTAQFVEMPETPSPDNQNATTLYKQLESQIQRLESQLKLMARAMNEGVDLVTQALNANQDWAKQYQPLAANWSNVQKLGWELDLLEKKAYPAMEFYKGKVKKNDLDKWKTTAIKIDSFRRVYGKNYTFPQILFHFTKQWDMFERFSFKKWYKWNYKQASVKMRKIADFVQQDRLQQFTQKRKKLLQRVNLVRKALHDFLNSGLISQQDSNAIYKIIAMLEFEAMKLQAPKVTTARVNRAAKLLAKHGFQEGSDILKQASQEFVSTETLKTVKVANADSHKAVDLLKKIKKEMDSLSYSKHLDALYDIKKGLEVIGRAGDAEAIEKVIRDELGSLEKFNKKLIEVYTNLSRVPLELSEQEDPTKPSQQSMDVPLEVSEEEATPPVSKPLKQPIKPLIQTKPQVVKPAPLPAPAIQERIPNV